MADDYNSNGVGHSVPTGGAFVFLTGAGATGGTYVVEGLTIERDGNAIMRSNHEGGYGGFAIPATPKQATGSCVIQIDTADTVRPEPGWYTDFEDVRGEFRLVISKVSDPYQAGTSWVVNADILLDHFATIA